MRLRFGSLSSRVAIAGALLLFLFVTLTFLPFTTAPSHLLYSVPHAEAETTDLTGFAWSDTMGWISMNCSNHSTCGTNNYKVVLDTETNHLEGYAWSEYAGWIQFGGLSGCPGTDPDCDARVEGGELNGWARMVNGDGITPDVPSLPVTQSYATPTTGAAFVVPSGVTEVIVKAWGAGGGGGSGGGDPSNSGFGNGGGGGGGGFSQSTISVTESEILNVRVGGGGQPGIGEGAGGGGGGYSGIFDSTTSLVVAAGGGGGGSGGDHSSYGGIGGAGGAIVGTDGQAGQSLGMAIGGGGGGGGTASSGGAPGINADSEAIAAQQGSLLNGGAGGGCESCDNVGVGAGGINGGGTGGLYEDSGGFSGGGGGGYYGGGGGGVGYNGGGGGGGGGSNYLSGSDGITLQGSGSAAANTTDVAYVLGVGTGGDGGENPVNPWQPGTSGNPGLVSLTYTSFVSPPTNGADGWISLSCENTGTCGASDFKVAVGSTELSGYAWGSDIMGWVSMSCTTGGPTGGDICATSNYRVSFTAPCPVANVCTLDHAESVHTDAWCAVATTTCSTGYVCKDTDGLCGYGDPSGTLTVSSNKVRRGATVNLSWNALYASTCAVVGTNSESWGPASSSAVTSSTIFNEVTYTLSCEPVGGGAPVLLDTERVSLIPSIKEF